MNDQDNTPPMGDGVAETKSVVETHSDPIEPYSVVIDNDEAPVLDDGIYSDEVIGYHNGPVRDVVDSIGKAVGVTFQDNEPLDLVEKIEKRDRDRWDLDPASAEQPE